MQFYVDNRVGSDENDGLAPGAAVLPSRHGALRTADQAFRLLPASWSGSMEIIFENTGINYPVAESDSTRAVYFGTPVGPSASPLVIRGAYSDLYTDISASLLSTANIIETATDILTENGLIGAVLCRISPPGAVMIRGNVPLPTVIETQQTLSPFDLRHTYTVQRPAVTLVPQRTWNVTSHDERSLNVTLVGIKIEPVVGAQLNLFNIRAQCDTCELSFLRNEPPDRPIVPPGSCFVHSSSRIQGGIEDANISPGLSTSRAQAGVYIHSTNPTDVISAVRGGILGGHLTFENIIVRVSQGGVFVPKSLEAHIAAIHILAGGAAIGDVGGWGTVSNKARIRSVSGSEGDGLRIFNGGSLNSPLSPINLDISGCSRDGIRVDAGSTASFGRQGEGTGLVSTNPNTGFGIHVRNSSRALVGPDTTLTGRGGDLALDDVAITPGWAVVRSNPVYNKWLSIACINH